jgi:hypothetical protein
VPRPELSPVPFPSFKVRPEYSLDYSLYYSVEGFFRGIRKIASIPLGSFLPTPSTPEGEVVHKLAVVGGELLAAVFGHAGVPPGRAVSAGGQNRPVKGASKPARD